MDRVFATARTRYVIPIVIIGAMFPFLLAAFVLPDWLETDESSVEIALLTAASYLAIFAALWQVWCRNHKLDDLLGYKPNHAESRQLIALGIPMVGVAIFSIYIVYFPLSFITPEFVKWWLLDNPEILVPLAAKNSIIINLVNIILLVLLAPITEEMIFRGFLLGRLHTKYGAITAILMPSVLFALLHGDILGAFIFSIFLCLIRIKYDSIIAPILVHMSNNAVVVVLLAVDMAIFGSEYEFSIQEFRSYWWYAPIGAVIGIPWLYWYFRTILTKSTVKSNVA